MRLRREIRPTASLDEAARREYYQRYAEVAELTREEFDESLAKKDWVVGFRDGAGALRGMMVIGVGRGRHPTSGRLALLLGVHHAAMDPSLRGRNLNQWAVFRFWLRLRARHPTAAIYWFFDTFSYKSYLTMTHTFRVGWPRHDQPMPAAEARLVDEVMRREHPAIWRPERGILAWETRRLREGVADIAPGDLADPDIAFFARTNPEHARGHTLVVLAPLTVGNVVGAIVDREVLRRIRRG